MQNAERIFTPAFIYKWLNASDYAGNLICHDSIGGFKFLNQYIDHDPLRGTSLHYVRNELSLDKIDVLVYPIRRLSWEDEKATSKEEAINFQKEVDLLQLDGQWQNVNLAPVEFMPWDVDGVEHSGARIIGTFEMSTGKQFALGMYLFIKEDKFIEIRTIIGVSDGRPEIEGEIEGTIRNISPPRSPCSWRTYARNIETTLFDNDNGVG